MRCEDILPARVMDDDWEFYHYRDGRWTWRNIRDAHGRLSDNAFDTWIEAMADAIVCGFEIGNSKLLSERQSRRAHPRVS